MLIMGLFFVAFGVLAELLGGTLFRSFLNWKDYPPRTSDLRVKTILGRITLLVGLAMTVIGLVIEIIPSA